MKKIFRKPFRVSFTKNILLILGILVAGYLVVILSLKAVTRHNQELTVPDFSGMSLEEAGALAGAEGLRIDVTDSVYIRGMERGSVSRQNPLPGSKVKKNRRILLVINSVIPRQSVVPSVTGYSLRQAKAELMSRGLQLGKLIYVNDIATNNVLSQLHNNSEIAAGTKIESGAVIDLVVGLNDTDNITYIPYVIGSRYMNAVNSIHDSSLNIEALHFDNTVADYSDSLDAVVYRQLPEMSEEPYRMGASVTLYLTKDSRKVPPRPEPETVIE